MRTLCDIDAEELASDMTRSALNPVHVRLILRRFYANAGEANFTAEQIGNRLKQWLNETFQPPQSRVVGRHAATDGTVKLLIELGAGGAVEAVLMPSHRPERSAGCVSSQIGCAMGCDFCASAIGGLTRDLTAGEIVEQFLHLKREAMTLGRRLSSIVFMGMGEPLMNLPSVLPAIRRIADPDLGGVGWRQVTVSTVGIVPGIDALADADLNVMLAVSLHAADDELRQRIVPMTRRYGVAEVMAAARRFAERTGRVPTIEWCLLAGVNDTDEQAEKLAQLMRGFRAHVNLIPFNPIGRSLRGVSYQRPEPDRVIRFATILQERGVVVHCRQTRGDDVAAACGQLKQLVGVWRSRSS